MGAYPPPWCGLFMYTDFHINILLLVVSLCVCVTDVTSRVRSGHMVFPGHTQFPGHNYLYVECPEYDVLDVCTSRTIALGARVMSQ